MKQEEDAIEGSIRDLRSSYAAKKNICDKQVKEAANFDERIAFAEMGVYEPHFEFSDSEEYKTAINVVSTSRRQ
ncbi:hypothetical protein I6F26_00330 [Ensifer sp. IC3342]|nr:hypothetical protein [Ensifer sp. BRP08]MCA1445042.1 hypothetical protein [Ensifer sp. IC3342]